MISIEIEVKNCKVKFQEYFLSDGFPFRFHTRFDNTILNHYFRKIFNEDFKLDRQDSKHKPPTLKFQFFLRRTHSKRASCLLLPPVLPTRASYHRTSIIQVVARSRNFNLDHIPSPLPLFKRIYRNQRYREIGEINYPGSCHSTVARSFHPKAGSRRAISCGDAPTRAWRESDSKFHGVYIDSAELTLNTFARRAGGSHARRFVERHAFLNRDLSRPSLRNR